jgi:hypothetical protein
LLSGEIEVETEKVGVLIEVGRLVLAVVTALVELALLNEVIDIVVRDETLVFVVDVDTIRVAVVVVVEEAVVVVIVALPHATFSGKSQYSLFRLNLRPDGQNHVYATPNTH